MEAKDLIYDWNGVGKPYQPPVPIAVHDESLRDGLQASRIHHPSLDKKIHLVRIMNRIGIDCANIGFPASSPEQQEMISEIARTGASEGWKISLMNAARAMISDVTSIVDVVQRTGVPVEAGIFIGSSRLRHFVQSWDRQELVKQTAETISFARSHGLSVMFVTEDTTRAFPKDIQEFYQAAIDSGASKLCICDTVGFADEHGTTKLVKFIKNKVVRNQTVDGKPIELEWHGHADRMMDMANTIAAVKAGASRVESTLNNVGERSGNTATEGILLNLHLRGWARLDLTHLRSLAEAYADATGRVIEDYHPIIGRGAFETASGVHADAIEKALALGREDLAALVYCGFDPRTVGGTVKATVGQMSGRSNVRLALKELGYPDVKPAVVEQILKADKQSSSFLTDEQLLSFVR